MGIDLHSIDSYDYELPEDLIAQHPPKHRGDSRMMVIDRAAETISHHQFAEFPDFLSEDDLLILNDTRVVPARFFSNDGKKEILRLDAINATTWRCLVKPGKKLRVGRTFEIGEATGTVVEVLPEGGDRIIEFDREPDEDSFGHLALPPYIDRNDTSDDSERYQTVYAKNRGAIAAPTAGLHFSAGMLSSLPHAFVTLHVGLGTFRPVSTDIITEHHMHSEQYFLPAETAQRINQNSGRTIAVGTTAVRVLESCVAESGRPLDARSGDTEIFIYPPYEFGLVEGLLTNFHLPKSTLMMLVSALAGRDLIMEAYRKAVEERYRFFSYGDCMLII